MKYHRLVVAIAFSSFQGYTYASTIHAVLNYISRKPIVGEARAKTVTLTGKVLLNGKPVTGVEVVASEIRNYRQDNWGAKTDENGDFKIPNVPGGTMDLSVQLGKLQSEWVVKPYKNLVVPEGGERDGLNFVLEKGLILKGYVRSMDDDEPVAGATVRVSPQPGTTVNAKTNTQGEFSARVPDGQIYVSVDEIARRPTMGQYYLRATVDAAHNPELDIRVPNYLLFSSISHLTGTVLDIAGKPAGGAVVRDLVTKTQASTDRTGHFRFDAPTNPGDLVVAIKEGAMSRVAVQIADKSNVDLLLDSRPAIIQGAIIGDDGKPMPGVEVSLGGSYRKAYCGYPKVTTNSEGKYRFNGVYGGIDSFFLWAKKNGYGSTTIQPIRITPAEIKTLETMKMEPADGTIDGTVYEADGKPAIGVTVSSQTQESKNVVTDDHGKFHLANVPRGQHYLAAGRGNSYSAGASATTGQKDVVIKMSPPQASTPGVVDQDKSGQTAPPIKIDKWINGSPVDLQSLKGKIVVVDFWAIWCHPCVEALPEVQALSDKYGKQGVVVIGIHVCGTPLDKINAFLKLHHLTYLMGLDLPGDSGLGQSAVKYAPQGIPSVYVIAPNGKIVSDSNEVADADKAIQKLLVSGKTADGGK